MEQRPQPIIDESKKVDKIKRNFEPLPAKQPLFLYGFTISLLNIKKEIKRLSKELSKRKKVKKFFASWNGGRIPAKIGNPMFEIWKSELKTNNKLSSEFEISDVSKFFVEYTLEDIEAIQQGKITEADKYGDILAVMKTVKRWQKKGWVNCKKEIKTCKTFNTSAEFEYFSVADPS